MLLVFSYFVIIYLLLLCSAKYRKAEATVENITKSKKEDCSLLLLLFKAKGSYYRRKLRWKNPTPDLGDKVMIEYAWNHTTKMPKTKVRKMKFYGLIPW